MSNSNPQIFSLEAVIFVIILLVYILASHLIEIRHVPYIHESTIAIGMGAATAIFAKYVNYKGFYREQTFGEGLEFSGEIFFTIILPPIIFSAGYSLRKSLFFENFGIITFLGVIGTIIAFILLSLILSGLNYFIFKTLTLSQVLMVSSVLCATDTVAAMSLIKFFLQPEKYPVLNAVLFGEGIINDAVAIILFRTVSELELGAGSEFTFGTFMTMVFDFCYLFFFSIALGLLFGFGLSYLLKINQSFLRFPIKQTSLILLNGYLTYLIGQVTGLSGIISLFTCAIIMGHYCFMNISQEAQRGTGLAFETVAYVAEAFVYAYLGASVMSIRGEWLAIGMAMLVLLFLPVIRAVMIYFLPCIYTLLKKQFPLNPKQLKICWYSGIVRGVIAFALCLQISGPHVDFIRTIALMIVMITTILGSSFLKPFAKWVGMDQDQGDGEIDPVNYQRMMDQRIARSDQISNYYNIGLGYESDTGHEGGEDGNGNKNGEGLETGLTTTKKMEQFENKFIKPLFQKKNRLSYQLQGGISGSGSGGSKMEKDQL